MVGLAAGAGALVAPNVRGLFGLWGRALHTGVGLGPCYGCNVNFRRPHAVRHVLNADRHVVFNFQHQ